MGTELNSVPFLTWARANLFSSLLNTALTLVCVCLIVMIGIPLVNWLFINAYWSGSTPADCPDKTAACWPFVRARFDQFMYGLYPATERWRVNLGLALIILSALPLFVPGFPGKRRVVVFAVIAWPLIGALLFLGGNFGLAYIETGKWGGFFLTVITALFVLSTSLPLAVLLALGSVLPYPWCGSVAPPGSNYGAACRRWWSCSSRSSCSRCSCRKRWKLTNCCARWAR